LETRRWKGHNSCFDRDPGHHFSRGHLHPQSARRQVSQILWAATRRVSPEEAESIAARRAPDEDPCIPWRWLHPDYAHVPSAWIPKMDGMGCSARTECTGPSLAFALLRERLRSGGSDSHAACWSQTDPLSNSEVHGTFAPSGGTMQGLPSRAVRYMPQSYTISTAS